MAAVPAAHSSLGWAYLSTGRHWNHDAWKSHYRYRWYDPHQCRWTALDPTGYAGGIEQYAYCAWNPVNFVDPLGLEGQYQFGGGGGWGERLADSIDASGDGLTARLASRGTGLLAFGANFQLMMQGEAVKFAADNLRLGTGTAEMLEGGDIHAPGGRLLTPWQRMMAGVGDAGRAAQIAGPLFAAGRGIAGWARGLGRPIGTSLNPSLGRRGSVINPFGGGGKKAGQGAERAVTASECRMADDRAPMSAEQLANLARFEKRLPANATPTRVFNLPNGGKAFQADSPATNIPGSFARYEKQVDAAGKTLQYTKTTFGPEGEIIHVKDKIGGGVLLP